MSQECPFFADMRRHEWLRRDKGTGRLKWLAWAFGLHALALYRLAHQIWPKPSPKGPLGRVRAWLALALSRIPWCLYGITISPEAELGRGLFIEHFGGIEIGPCRVGESCSVHQQVRIGATAQGGYRRPHIGSRVWIGPHARILPGVCIGDGATILAGAVVDSDIPAGALAGGNPARVVMRSFDNLELINGNGRVGPKGSEGGKVCAA